MHARVKFCMLALARVWLFVITNSLHKIDYLQTRLTNKIKLLRNARFKDLEHHNLTTNYEITLMMEINSINKNIKQLSRGVREMQQQIRNISNHIQSPFSLTVNDNGIENKMNIKYIGKDIKLKDLIYGFIRLTYENKNHLYIPSYLKEVCLQFYGNIQIKSNILNFNQINIVGYLLKEKFKMNHIQYFMSKIVYDSTKMNVKSDNDWNNTMVVVETNNNHIYIQFYLCKDALLFGYLIKSAFTLKKPIIYPSNNNKCYHFSSDYQLTFKQKLSDIFFKYDDIIFIDEIGDINQHYTTIVPKIERFEVFKIMYE